MANIVVVGAGVVGQATGKGLQKKGHSITFVDICADKLAQLRTQGYVNNFFDAVKISYFNEVHQQCEALGIDSGTVSAVVARSAESLWNPLYGTRGGAPYGGACLPKDTTAFLSFCTENELPHCMLAATIAVNEQLQLSIPAVASPDEIDDLHRRYLLPAHNILLASEA